MDVPARVTWAVRGLDLQPGDRVLEVGGGTGASAGLVLERIGAGHLVALDRSATAAARIAATHPDAVARGRLTVVQGALADLDGRAVPPASVDVAFAVDVNVFWTTGATAELGVLRRVLVPGGRLALCFGTDGPRADAVRGRVLDPVAAHVRAAGFTDVRVRVGTAGVGVLAQAPADG